MKRKIIYTILSFGIFVLSSCFEKSKIQANNTTKFTLNSKSATIIKDLDAKKFIDLCLKNYKEDRKLNFVVFSGDFPQDFITKQDIEYLVANIDSKQKCCGYMHIFSSYISSDNAEVGGFAILFLKSYIEKKQLNLGLNSNPKIDKKEILIIKNWYKNEMQK
ncbi:Lipoprotein [Flavobacterium branchiophilum]|uniref:Hypothetical lipoprotein n=1 Tax=Flavobacterium branchiophilum (strain FL-15) TaxID=1034807 RepID=G2Z0Y8_FLABF|nr:hypothetical protein [Flavobacterium branchiophilum]CCB69535.1 Hypothetical lipoprotein precursor [Flavobacterium branchiophilum FL-15]